MTSEISNQLAILAFVALVLFFAVFFSAADINLAGNNQGYKPQQPIRFSHRLHSGDLQVGCLYCHSAAEKSRHAGIPAADTCMNCHRFVTGDWDLNQVEQQRAREEGRSARPVVSEELEKLYEVVGFDAGEMRYVEGQGAGNLEWVQVHRVPDFVYFDHRSHVTAGVLCQTCHGLVETMETVSQESDLSMGWCVNCHRDVNRGLLPELEGRFASTACGVCHY